MRDVSRKLLGEINPALPYSRLSTQVVDGYEFFHAFSKGLLSWLTKAALTKATLLRSLHALTRHEGEQ